MLPRFNLSLVAVSTCERKQGNIMEVEAIGTFDVKPTLIGAGESPIGSMPIDVGPFKRRLRLQGAALERMSTRRAEIVMRDL